MGARWAHIRPGDVTRLEERRGWLGRQPLPDPQDAPDAPYPPDVDEERLRREEHGHEAAA